MRGINNDTEITEILLSHSHPYFPKILLFILAMSGVNRKENKRIGGMNKLPLC
jgi:hypothetical protein